jgi:hypothetical protein
MGKLKRATVFFNKVGVLGHLLLSWFFVVGSFLASRSGEGGQIHYATRASSRWQGAFLLQLGVSSMADKFVVVILGQRCDPSRRHVVFLQPSMGEALYGVSGYELLFFGTSGRMCFVWMWAIAATCLRSKCHLIAIFKSMHMSR